MQDPDATALKFEPPATAAGDSARPLVAETELPTLDKVSVEASTCTACGLAKARNNVVFGEGDPHSPLVLIGEGPGEQEDLTGRPFVGRAGKLLDRALMDCGLDRSDVYICNILKCRAADWREGRAQNRAPAADEVAACNRWLDPQLRIIAPKVLLCIGGPSASHLIHKNFLITKERGKLFTCRYAEHALATLHPAYVLRQQGRNSDGGYSLLVEDIALAWMKANPLE
ncbi:MAG: uracil-DNA glycosylase [Armatimonadetes bacterium]|nr:uracil-DNA glycosylase [Armatimonadota bacterium]